MLPRSGTSSVSRFRSIVRRCKLERVQKFTVTLKRYHERCITKRWRGSPVRCTGLLLSPRQRGGGEIPRGRTRNETKRGERGTTRSVGGVCSLLPGDRVHRLLVVDAPKSRIFENRPTGSTRLAFSSKAAGRQGNRRGNEARKRKAEGRKEKRTRGLSLFRGELAGNSYGTAIEPSLHVLPFVTVHTVALCT